MALRNISNQIKNALADNDSLLVYHLVKFEKPSQLAREAQKATDYVYLTDAPYEVSYDSNDYQPGGVLKVGKVPENTEAKATSLSLTLSATKLGKRANAVSVTNSSIAANGTGTLTVNFDLFKSGFYAGDTVKFTKRSDNTVTFRGRIDRLHGDGTKVDITSLEDTTISANSSVSFDIRFDSSEVDALVSGGVDNSGTETVFSSVSFDNYINRSVTIYRVFADPADGSRIGEPVLLFKGIISKGTLNEKVQGASTITWSLTSHWGDFVRVNGRITSDEFHRGLDSSGISNKDSAIRPEYIQDLGFMHADSSLNVLATYTDLASRFKSVRRGGLAGLLGGKKLKEEKYEVTRELDLSINLDAKYIPLVYGVQKVDTIPVFADVVITQDTNADDNVSNGKTELFQAQVLCEGPIGGVYDIYMEDKSLVCRDLADSDVRLGSSDDIPCFGRMDRGDVLSGGNLFSTTPMSEILYGSTEDLENTDIWVNDPNVVMELPRLFGLNLNFQNSTTGKNGILHEQSFRATLANDIQITVHAGREDQRANQSLLGVANAQDFLVQQQYYQDDATTYWTANHKLLDTAYVVTRDTITAEDGKAPDLSFVVRGKFVDCHNYDGSYRISNGLHTNFDLGDTVSITLADGTTSGGTARIVDKWSFLNASNLTEYRIRLGQFSSSSTEDAIITDGDIGKFSITKDSNTLTFLSPEYSNNPNAPVSPTDELAAAGFVFSGSNFTNKSVPLERKVTDVTTYEPIYLNTADGPEMIGTQPVVRKNYKYTLDFSSLPSFTQNALKVAKETSALLDLTVTANSYTETLGIRMADLDTSTMEYVVTGLTGRMEALFGNPSNTAGTTTVTATGGTFVNRSLIKQNSTDTLDPTDAEGITIEVTQEDISPEDYSIRMPSTTALRTFCNTNNIICLNRGLHTRFSISDIKYKYGVQGTHLDIEQWGDFRVSTNPAMQLLDYLTNDRYGKGLKIGEDLDLNSFREVARSCDTRSDVTILVPTSASITKDEKYRYPATGDLLWEGTVSEVKTITYNIYESYKQVTFTNCIGKLGRKWNNWYGFSANELVWTKGGNWTVAASAGTIATEPSSAGGVTVNIRKVGSDPAVDVPINTTFNTNLGNPFVKKYENNNWISGYSLYDSDDVKYWKYVGWDTPDQRFVTRHQTNMTVDTSQSLFDNANSMLRQFNGILRFANGVYFLDQKVKAKDIDDFTSDEIITEDFIVGDIKITDKGISKTFNSVNAQIIDPANNFETRSIAFYNSNYKKQDKGIPRQGSYEAPGISNYFNARMNIKQVLDESRAGLDISFTMAPRGYMLLAGNIIAITYDKFNWTKKLFRIESLSTRDDLLVDVVAKEHNDNAYIIEAPASDLVASYAQESGGKPPVEVRVPTSLTATDSGGGGVDLSWTNADNYNDATHTVEIWRSDSASFSGASLIGTTKGTKYTDVLLDTGDQTRYYWIRYSIRTTNSIGNAITKNSKYEPRSTADGVTGSAVSIVIDEIETGITIDDGGITFPDTPGGTPSINAGITDLDTGNPGFFLGHDGTNYVMQVGDPAGDNFKFDGTNLSLTGSEFSVTASGAATPSISGTTITGKGALLKADGDVLFGDAAGFNIFFDQSEGTLTLTGEMVTEDNIATDAITADKIAANSITANEIAANSITADEIAANSITANAVKANSVVASLIDAETITSNHIAANSIAATILDVENVNAVSVDTFTLSALAADIGDITAGTLRGGNVADANAAPDAGESGAFLNLTDGKMVFGDSSKYILFDGTDLELNGVVIDATSTVNAPAQTALTLEEDGSEEITNADVLNFTSGLNVTVADTTATISIDQASTTGRGGIKLASDTQQTVDPETVSSTSSRTYSVQLNSDGEAVVNVPWTSGGTYVLPAANSTTLGGIELFDDGTQTEAAQSVSTTANRTYGLQINSDGQGVINVPWTDTVYTLPEATETARGGIELFSSTEQTVAAENVSDTANRTYGIQLNSDGQAVVNVPWTDTGFSLSAATSSTLGGIELFSDTQQTVAAESVSTTANRTYGLQINSDGQGVINVPWTDTNTEYSTATDTVLGLVKTGYTATGQNYPVALSNGQMYVNVPWTDNNTEYSDATQSASGLMSSTDKTKLDGIATGADVTPSWVPATDPSYQVEPSEGAFANGDKTKLDGIATGADVTPSWVPATDPSYQVEPSEGAFANGDKTKLDGIATGADVTPSWVPASDPSYQVQPSEGAFANGDKTKLDGIATGADVTPSWVPASDPSYQVQPSEGAFANGDKTKLDGIATGATNTAAPFYTSAIANATQSAAGLMSSTDKTKLDGVETSADVTDTANVVAALTAGTNITIAADGTISSTDNNTIYSAGTGLSLSDGNAFSVDSTVVVTSGAQTIGGDKTFSNNVTVTGDLTVNGTTTSINTTNLTIEDNVVVVNAAQSGTPEASVTAGLEVERGDETNKTFLWKETNSRWSFGSESVEAGTFYGSFIGSVTGSPSSLSGLSTDDLAEGSTNLYYTDDRARSAISQASGGGISYSSSNGEISVDSTVIRTTGNQTLGGVKTFSNGIKINGGNSIHFENDKHLISYNDGRGNFNIRVGTDDDEVVTEAGYVFHTEWSQSSGFYAVYVSPGSQAVGDQQGGSEANDFNWREQFKIDQNKVYLRYQGGNVLNTNNTGINVNGDITVSGTVDGRDLATDGTKLDGIATGATNTAAPYYTSAIPNATTSAAGLMSDTDKTKLNGIATGATNTAAPYYTSAIPNATTSAAGLMSDTDKTKLNGIATGADVTPSWVPATDPSYQVQPSEGAFANGDKTKLDGIATGADVTPSWVPATDPSYQVEPSEGAFANGDKTKLDGIATGADVTPSWVPASDPSYQVQPSEGAFANGDKTKLDGIATGATNTAAPYYTSAIPNATTSAAGLMSDTDKTKLNGIATGATNTAAPFYTSAISSSDVTTALGYTPYQESTALSTTTISSTHSSNNGVSITATDSSANSSFNAMRLDYNVSGTTALNADRNHIGLYIDVDSNATGGDTSNEHRLYGLFSDVRATGDSDLIVGSYASARADDFTSGTITNIRGSYGLSYAHQNAGTVTSTQGAFGYGINRTTGSGQASNIYGVYGSAFAQSTSTYNNSNYYAGYFITQVDDINTSDINNLYGVYSEVQFDNGLGTITVDNVYGVMSIVDHNDATPSPTITKGYLFYGDYQGTKPTTAYGVWIPDDVENRFGGIVRTNNSFKVDDFTVINSSRVLANVTTDAAIVTSGTFDSARIPQATSAAKGGIELFSDTTQPTAANNVSETANRTYGIQLNSAGQAVVNVPWSNTNTTYTASGALELSGTEFKLTDPANLSELDEGSDDTDDKVLLWDESADAWKYMTLDNLQDSIDQLNVPNNANISIGAGDYLTDGGNFTTNQADAETITLNVDATTASTAGKVVARDSNGDIAARLLKFDNEEKSDLTVDGQLGFDSSQGLLVRRTQQNVSAATVTVLDGANVAAGTGISILNLGSGVNGGGTGTEKFTFSVDSTVVSTSGAQTIGGAKTFTQNMVINQGEAGDATLTIKTDTDNNDEGDHPSIVFEQDGAAVKYRIGIGATDADASDVNNGGSSNKLVISTVTPNATGVGIAFSEDNGATFKDVVGVASGTAQTGTLLAEVVEADIINANMIEATSVVSDIISANTITAQNLSVLSRDLINPVSTTQHLAGWAGVTEDSTSTTAAADRVIYNSTYNALELDNNTQNNASVSANSFIVRPDKIYKLSYKVKSSVTHSSMVHVGLSYHDSATEGLQSQSNQAEYTYKVFERYTPTRTVNTSASDNFYFMSESKSTEWREYVHYIIGGNRSVNDCPDFVDQNILDGNATAHAEFPFVKVQNTPVTSTGSLSGGTDYVSNGTNVATTGGSGEGLTVDYTVSSTGPAKTIGSLTSGGTNYGNSVTRTNQATTGGTGSGLTVDYTTNSSGAVISVTLNNRGSGYTANDVITISGGNNFAKFPVSAVRKSISSVTLNNRGRNYEVGDTITISGQSGDATFQVTGVNDVAHVQLRLLNFNNGSTNRKVYFKDMSITEVGSGQIVAENIQISNNSAGSAGIYMDYNNGNSRIDIRDSSALRVRIGYLGT